MPSVVYRREVLDDLREAADWYDGKRSGLGDDFLAEFWTAIDSIIKRPLSFAKTFSGLRASRLKRFPYVVHFHYSEDDDELIVYAVMFGGRDTSEWIDRI